MKVKYCSFPGLGWAPLESWACCPLLQARGNLSTLSVGYREGLRIWLELLLGVCELSFLPCIILNYKRKWYPVGGLLPLTPGAREA